MANELSFTGYLTEDFGHIEFDFQREVRLLARKLKGKKLEVKIKEFRDTRSARQNRYFWAVIIPNVKAWLLETQGEKHTQDEVYSYIRLNVLGQKPRVAVVMGQEVIVIEDKGMSTMNTLEFAEAVDNIREYFKERGLEIPEPTGSNTLVEHYRKRNYNDE